MHFFLNVGKRQAQCKYFQTRNKQKKYCFPAETAYTCIHNFINIIFFSFWHVFFLTMQELIICICLHSKSYHSMTWQIIRVSFYVLHGISRFNGDYLVAPISSLRHMYLIWWLFMLFLIIKFLVSLQKHTSPRNNHFLTTFFSYYNQIIPLDHKYIYIFFNI